MHFALSARVPALKKGTGVISPVECVLQIHVAWWDKQPPVAAPNYFRRLFPPVIRVLRHTFVERQDMRDEIDMPCASMQAGQTPQSWNLRSPRLHLKNTT
jgi:hypothetical protein